MLAVPIPYVLSVGTGSYEGSTELLRVKKLGSKKVKYIASCSDSSFGLTGTGSGIAKCLIHANRFGVFSRAGRGVCLGE